MKPVSYRSGWQFDRDLERGSAILNYSKRCAKNTEVKLFRFSMCDIILFLIFILKGLGVGVFENSDALELRWEFVL